MARKKVPTAKKRKAFTRWDPVEHLTSEDAIMGYLDAAMEEAGDDPTLIAAVLGDIARARGILELAEKTGMTRAGLYRALSADGNPSFDTILKVTKALGLRVTISKAA